MGEWDRTIGPLPPFPDPTRSPDASATPARRHSRERPCVLLRSLFHLADPPGVIRDVPTFIRSIALRESHDQARQTVHRPLRTTGRDSFHRSRLGHTLHSTARSRHRLLQRVRAGRRQMPQAEKGHLLALQHAVGGGKDAHQPGPSPAHRLGHAFGDPMSHVSRHASQTDHVARRLRVHFQVVRPEMFQLQTVSFQDVKRARVFAWHEFSPEVPTGAQADHGSDPASSEGPCLLGKSRCLLRRASVHDQPPEHSRRAVAIPRETGRLCDSQGSAQWVEQSSASPVTRARCSPQRLKRWASVTGCRMGPIDLCG
jgi:hypothetical protein